MENHSFYEKRFKELEDYFGDDVCREAKNHLYECLVLYSNYIAEAGIPEKHDDFMNINRSLYDYFNSLDSVFSDEIQKE